MRLFVAPLVVACALLVPAPAGAEPPIGVRATLCLGTGVGHRDNLVGAGPSGFAAVELLWRYRPGRAVVVSYVTGGGPAGLAYVPEAAHLEYADHRAVLIGLEASRLGGGGFLHAGLGVGRVTTDGFPGLEGMYDPETRAHWARPFTETGVALMATAGLRLVPRPGPMGFILAFQTSNVVGPTSSSNVLGFTFGITLHPLGPRPAAPGP